MIVEHYIIILLYLLGYFCFMEILSFVAFTMEIRRKPGVINSIILFLIWWALAFIVLFKQQILKRDLNNEKID